MAKARQYRWFNMWMEDKDSMIATMMRNIASDLEAGYNPTGNAISKARRELDEYIERYDEEARRLREMTYEQAERWCHIDLKRRGAIE